MPLIPYKKFGFVGFSKAMFGPIGLVLPNGARASGHEKTRRDGRAKTHFSTYRISSTSLYSYARRIVLLALAPFTRPEWNRQLGFAYPAPKLPKAPSAAK
jgi:hypothetical protein